MRYSGVDEKIYDKSICPANILCDFERISESDGHILERCRCCGRREFYSKNSLGEVSNFKYVGDHLRDTLQPFGRTRGFFLRIYGSLPEERLKDEIERRNRRSKDKKKWQELREDLKRKNT